MVLDQHITTVISAPLIQQVPTEWKGSAQKEDHLWRQKRSKSGWQRWVKTQSMWRFQMQFLIYAQKMGTHVFLLMFLYFFYVGEHEWTWVKGKNRAFLFDDKPKWWNKDRTVRILEDLVLWSEATTSEVPALPEMWYCKQFFLTYMLTQKHMRTFISIWGFPKMGVPPNHYF